MSGPLANSIWGSSVANLTVGPNTSTLRLLASGGCVGSWVNVVSPAVSASFDVAGTYTQLIGAYPGMLTYPARITGSARGTRLTLTVMVPALQLVIDELDLTRGVSHNWPNCLYP